MTVLNAHILAGIRQEQSTGEEKWGIVCID